MKATTHILAVLGLVLCLAATSFLLCPSQSSAQAMPSWLGGGRIWDWSDFRGNVGFRVYMPRLITGSVQLDAFQSSLQQNAPPPDKYWSEDYEMLSTGNVSDRPQPDFFKEGWFILYIDRLALRAHFEEDHRFRGVASYDNDSNQTAISELDVGWTRFGLDLDIIRYPFLRVGINWDRHFESVIYLDRRHKWLVNWPDSSRQAVFVPKLTTRHPPVTIGVHGFASPGRVFGIPVTAQARARFPFPFLAKIVGDSSEARITEWEVCVGLRPNVWNTSLYGYTTFAMGIDVGFK
ncbi:MAG: hypothetical protein ACPL7J_15560, partial [Desulfomonilaceae bacterium]